MSNKYEFGDFLPSLVLAMEKPPAFYARLVSLFVILFVVIAILWACFSKVDIVVSAQGKVVPSGNVKVIQAPEAGVVRAIHVRDGQYVNKGDTLLDFDTTVSRADFTQLTTRYDSARLVVQRIKILLGENIAFGQNIKNSQLVSHEQAVLASARIQFNENLKQLELERDQASSVLQASDLEANKLANQIKYYREKSKEAKRHAKSGLISRRESQQAVFDYENAKKDYSVQLERRAEANKKYLVSSEKVNIFKIDHRSELLSQLAEANSELEDAKRAYVTVNQQMAHQSLKSPVAGVVQQLKVHTIGAVITRADELLVLVPDDSKLEVEASILNKDIGFVNTQQFANVKIDAFEYTRYGHLKGELDWVASDAVIDKDKGPIYPARIKVDSTTLPRTVNNRVAQILPGMSVTADIVIGQRRLIAYFFGPILRYKDEALNER